MTFEKYQTIRLVKMFLNKRMISQKEADALLIVYDLA